MTTTPMTLLGALTSTYTPIGATCNSIHFAINPLHETGWFALGAIETDYLTSSCMPGGYTRAPQYYYSPGVCPSGYTPACSASLTTDSAVTTLATCCPTGYVCYQNRGDNIYGCTSLVTSESVLTVLSVSYETITGDSTTSYPIDTATITTTISQDEYMINAYGVIVQRQADDPAFVSTSGASTSTSTASSGTVASVPSETGTSTAAAAAGSSSSSSSSSELSTGAKVGLGVGVSLAAILFIGSIVFFFLSRRRARNAAGQGEAGQAGHLSELGSPNSANWSGQPVMVSQMDASSIAQPYGQPYKDQQYASHNYAAPAYHQVPQQLSADSVPVEMSAEAPKPASHGPY
ncbi:hypothetical protein PFICI_09130 [Pestalotiopsis fici W106-1]|uniref:Mid2 domain-containing protein n=1 Tax=Pestalotiopsis fici (strain W106-1 / CGMCC3.15140) TaxID=1229662 RepID=W3X1N4_PESFW|nr:uncharacterized protein PFICI_09130 [Pestalotiopsis fici W106-1]ETS79277.1 hypothetical protein PFICI_09130 [Pestalotiopsis fici W106-1]